MNRDEKIILEARTLYKDYGIKDNIEHVIKGISLKIHEGDFISILGPSGSGKSTLLYLLSTLEKVTKGEIYYKGNSYSSINESNKSSIRNEEFGFVFQNFNLINDLTVEDNILLPITLGTRKQKIDREKLNDILKFVDIYDKREKNPTELSGGQKQRVAIARALITEPKVLFADEPIGSLDSKNGEMVMEIFRNINKKNGTTIIQVTHDEDTVKYGNRVITVKDGAIYDKETKIDERID
ncbi:ABC transporter ATP-binding protein [Clostridium akagii]|uniref:ABC transporter ATP-binding protein n=1 Tax=Clostridium akagii TaxID=91623 RepID=UPI00047A4C3A|nr:ABC transporter ATP-binding protein [Clostridium akagii]